MAVDVYFKEDILNVLRAAENAAGGFGEITNELCRQLDMQSIPVNKVSKIWWAGFNCAITAIALGFGLFETQGQAIKALPNKIEFDATVATSIFSMLVREK